MIKPITSFSTKKKKIVQKQTSCGEKYGLTRTGCIHLRASTEPGSFVVTFHPKNDKLGLVSVMVSHGVVQHDVLFGQLQQHGIVKELADTDVLAQTLQSKQRSHHTCSNTRLHDTTEGEKKLTLRLRVLIMNSRARWGAGCGSRGLITMLLSRGSPGTI